MNPIKLLVIVCISISIWGVAYSETENYWACFAEDSSHKQWGFESKYQRMAVNQSLDNCKKQSEAPMTCSVSQENCEFFMNGLSTRPMWRCTALDARADVWRSTVYNQQYDAVLGAKAYCHQHSPSPDSCYAYVQMCKKLNKG